MPDELMRRLDEAIGRMETLTATVERLQAERHDDVAVQQRLVRMLLQVQTDQRKDRRRTYLAWGTGIIAVLAGIGAIVQTFRLNRLAEDVRTDRCRSTNSGFEQARRDVRGAIEGVGDEVNAAAEQIERVLANMSRPGTVDSDCDGDGLQTDADYLDGFAPAGLPVPSRVVPD